MCCCILIQFQIRFENRKDGDTGEDCLLSDDGVDFLMQMSWVKQFNSIKFGKSGHSALRYEIGLCIKTGNICWDNGPFEPGMYNDNMIFQMGLAGMLEEGERVEAGKGYMHSAPEHIRYPGWLEPPERAAMTQRVRCRHETVNKRMKQWNILRAAYRHDMLKHQQVFGAILALTQLSIENGEPLFQVEYLD